MLKDEDKTIEELILELEKVDEDLSRNLLNARAASRYKELKQLITEKQNAQNYFPS